VGGRARLCNKYRIVVWIDYLYLVVCIRFIGTIGNTTRPEPSA
jgi:mRNA-degrading endonuclease HigB of HigAB toxin-antitoxin module